MARALFYTAPGQGHAMPPIATAIAMRERGHEVIVHTAGEYVPALESAGLEAVPIDPGIEAIPLEDWRARTPVGALVSACRTFNRRAVLEVPDLLDAIAAERPDLLWIDSNATGASAVAAASGLPWAHCMPYPYPVWTPGVPIFGPGFAPSPSRLAHLRDAGLNALRPIAFRSFMRGHNAVRAELGLPPLADSDDLFRSADRLILFTAEPFEYPRAWPAEVRLVGPALWEPPAAKPSWLAGEERPIVLVTASTIFQDDARLIRCAFEALAESPYALVATCAAHDPAEFDPPANAMVERHLPHGPILRRAAAVISHGGMGITQKALAAGVPVCVVPFMRDQFEVARRVEHSGAGTLLRPGRLRPDRLRAAVELAVSLRAGAVRIRDAFAEAGGAEAAATELEALARARVAA
jgi:MGT family glycosyltransferase